MSLHYYNCFYPFFSFLLPSHIIWCFYCRMLIKVLVMVSSRGCMSTGWMSLRHLEGMIFIHLKRDYSFPFVSEPYLIILDQCLFSCAKFHTRGNDLFYICATGFLLHAHCFNDQGLWEVANNHLFNPFDGNQTITRGNVP